MADEAVSRLLAALRADPRFMRNVTAWKRLPARPARTAPWPSALDRRLVAALQAQGIEALYTHQAQAVEAALEGEHVIIVTGTASGKTLCYNLPVLQALLNDPTARALYLFPTKALAQDQVVALERLTRHLGAELPALTYDGDTPRSRRAAIRRRARILVTNPDMLHVGILPHHTRWAGFFGGLRYVVLDEVHTYRGVFGSHVANLLRRLRRIAAFYGSAPRFLLTSATIANPQDLAERLVEAPVTLVDEDGSPQGEKAFIFYNPPLVDRATGMRRSLLLEAREIALRFLQADLQTVLFARARLSVEVLLGYLRDGLVAAGGQAERVRGYRGGYLPAERRAIERGLREGTVRGVVATNALELGVDIGELSAALLVGYPGTIASTWQQAGRAGRRAGRSVAVLIAGPSALDQYLITHPDYFFGRSPEHALIQPDNLVILVNHLRCAAFELPFEAGEPFGGVGEVDRLLHLLAEEGEAFHASGGVVRWVGEGYPAAQVSLRAGSADPVLIIDLTDGRGQVIGQVDRPSAPLLVHEGAVYLHEGNAYLVERLDWEAGQAFVREAGVDYYTEASAATTVQVLEVHETQETAWTGQAHGVVRVVTEPLGYRQVKRYSHETLGWHDILLPPQEMTTTAFWLWLTPAAVRRLEREGVLLPPLDYGPNWAEQRERARARDGYRCRRCGAPEPPDRQHHVHHIRPFREFGYVPGENEAYREANALENLITLCPRCHRRAEVIQRRRGALSGLAHALHQMAPLHLMCDPRDLTVVVEARSGQTGLPTITLYERVPGGIGLSAGLYEMAEMLLRAAYDLVRRCPCAEGCPACVGPTGELASRAKVHTRRLLEMLCSVADPTLV